MKKTKLLTVLTVFAISTIITACEKAQDDNKTITVEPGKSITIIDNVGKETKEANISIESINKIDNIEILDWLDETRAIVSKENDTLEKLSLLELSESYPRSLYIYDLNSNEYKLLKEVKNVFLGGAMLSEDKKHLIYSEYTLGDPMYYVLNMDTLESFPIRGEQLPGATSAHWADNDTIIGTSFGGVYMMNTKGEITILDEFSEESFYFIKKIDDVLYYNSIYENEPLTMYNISTKEKVSLDLYNVYNIIVSPSMDKLLLLQDNGTKSSLTLCDLDGKNTKVIAYGTDLNGVSWSLDKRFIAYNMKEDGQNSSVNSLSVYDMLTNEVTQIVVDIPYLSTNWNPDGKRLIFVESDGIRYNSSIVELNLQVE